METTTITAFLENASVKKVREEKLDGRDYLVVPTAMITVGVHNGSHGPVFYSEDELSRTTTAWNMKPVVVFHPKATRTSPATAARPDVIEKMQVGFLLNTEFDKATKKLRTESWIDIAKANKVDPRIVKAVRAGRPMEVSTGLGSEFVQNSGEYNGVKYSREAKNHQPDHFALLPEGVGACSIAAGAGLLVTNEDGGWVGDEAAVRQFAARLADSWIETAAARADEVVTNGLSYGEVSELIRNKLRSSYGEPGKSWYGTILDLYDSTVVYEAPGGGCFSVGYTLGKAADVVLNGTPTAVRRVYKYADLSTGKIIANAAPEPPAPPLEKKTVTKTEKIAALIANGQFVEADRAALEAMPDPTFDRLTATKPAPAPTPVPVVTNTTPVPVTLEGYLDTVPEGFREIVVNALNTHATKHAALVEMVTNAPGNKFTKEQLTGMKMDVLEGIAALVPGAARPSGLNADAVNYFGMQGAPVVTNRNTAEEAPPLVAPTYAKKNKAAA